MKRSIKSNTFHARREDIVLIDQIVDRMQRLAVRFDLHHMAHDRAGLMMDVLATHSQCPLRLSEFLAADEFNFAHDAFGIYRHMNRDTARLDNCFVPRFAA